MLSAFCALNAQSRNVMRQIEAKTNESETLSRVLYINLSMAHKSHSLAGYKYKMLIIAMSVFIISVLHTAKFLLIVNKTMHE